MVKLKIIIRSGSLVLRISENKDRFYKNVEYLLKGSPDLKHWKADREQFSGYSPFHEENNRALADFKQIYWKLVVEHPELTARQISDYYKNERRHTGTEPVELADWTVAQYANCVDKYLEVVTLREKAKAGCNYEGYYKLLQKCRREIPGFETMAFSTLDYNKMVQIANIFAKGKAYVHHSKKFRAMLGKASKDKDVMFHLTQIGDFKFADYNPDRYAIEGREPDVLSAEELKAFLNLSVEDITPQYKDRRMVEIYYDFCVFMFHSFFAPCDVIKAKWRDITRKGTIVVRRKKTHRPVEVPVTPVMRQIINKYKGQSKDGYIFPIMDDEKEKTYTTKDYTFKKFREFLNKWLKVVGKELKLSFDLYAYVFRHTAITVAIDHGLSVSYVANAAGTRVEMIQQHYYNGECQQNRDKLTEAFMMASE